MTRLEDHSGDDWKEMAKIYKQLTVGTSHKPIAAILDKIDKAWPLSEATSIHDNGCGPGAIVQRLVSEHGATIPSSCQLTASDFSSHMIEQLNNTKKEEVEKNPNSVWSRVETSVLNAMDLQGVPDNSRSHVTAGWVYFMTPDPQKCLSESLRILKPGGVLGLSSWKGSQWIDLMNLITRIKADIQMPTIPDAWKEAVPLKDELEKAGFKDVESVEVDVEMTFDDYDSFVTLITEKMPHMIAITKDFSEEQKTQFRELILEETRKLAPTLPGTLHGVALVAVGRK